MVNLIEMTKVMKKRPLGMTHLINIIIKKFFLSDYFRIKIPNKTASNAAHVSLQK